MVRMLTKNARGRGEDASTMGGRVLKTTFVLFAIGLVVANLTMMDNPAAAEAISRARHAMSVSFTVQQEIPPSFEENDSDAAITTKKTTDSNKKREGSLLSKQRDDYVAACLMIMDGNHELIEWLAYHYYTLPLRRLIVLNDPNSKTTPQPILQRWKGKIEISLWNDTKVFPNGLDLNDETIKQGQEKLLQNEKERKYIVRQKNFYGACYNQLYEEEGHRWVLAFDVDEYMTINERVYDPNDPMYQLKVKSTTMDDTIIGTGIPTMGNQNATLHFIKTLIRHVHKFGTYSNEYLIPFETPCIGYFRKQYQPYEEEQEDGNNNNNFPLTNIQPKQLSTFRWRYWEVNKFQMGKALLDLDRINQDEIPENPSPHMPLPNKYLCRATMAYVAETKAPLIMNHYAAALDQSLFRSTDSRGNIAYRLQRYETDVKNKQRRRHEPNGKILGWLQGFVDAVGGQDEAERLLQHAGKPYQSAIGAYFDPSQELTEEEGLQLQAKLIAKVKAGGKGEEEATTTTTLVSSKPTLAASNNNRTFCGNSSIPKVMHFVYLSPGLPINQPPVPDRVTKVVDRWKKMNPYWEIILWNNGMVREHFPYLGNLMVNVTQMAFVADNVRYHVMEKMGGIYLDTDFVPLQPLDELCQQLFAKQQDADKNTTNSFVVCQDPHKTPEASPTTGIAMSQAERYCGTVINAVMGFPPNHRAIRDVWKEAMKSTQWAIDHGLYKYRLKYTFWPFTATWKDPSVSVLHPYTFLPCFFRQKEDCIESKYQTDKRVFAMHLWDKSW